MPEMSEDLSGLEEAIEQKFRRQAILRQNGEGMLISLESSLRIIQRNRPNDRSEIDRRYAVLITDFEKVMAYFKTYIVDEYMLSGVSQSPSKADE